MSNIVIVGYIAEGKTDMRFLESIIRRTFEEIAAECESMIEIHSVVSIPTSKKKFELEVLNAAKTAAEVGVMVLCIHTDADDSTDENAFNYKIKPGVQAIEKSNETICKILVPIVPIYMTEAWLLADVDLLIQEIGTKKTVNELGLQIHPESISDPKKLIEEVIEIAFRDKTRRQKIKSLRANELYYPIGQKIDLEKLKSLESYIKFQNAAVRAFSQLNYR